MYNLPKNLKSGHFFNRCFFHTFFRFGQITHAKLQIKLRIKMEKIKYFRDHPCGSYFLQGGVRSVAILDIV